jgi:hypothetical protein
MAGVGKFSSFSEKMQQDIAKAKESNLKKIIEFCEQPTEGN